jgi:GxxExxY protein
MHTDNSGINALSQRVIGCAYQVLNTLGVGFLEKVYENALVHELRKADLHVEQQHKVTVHYDNIIVGEYAIDVLVENAIIIELKAARALDSAHIAQCLNYLKATSLPMCLLLNFGKPRLEIRRFLRSR